ncbi:TetR family transcriptional regulator [Pseudonocardia ailaonensis]|uniref:TetR family transcriptional regulator n=1 Tax=Pseudonocardia ailaonensis TaxID=367279 RepID=A0ABN2NPX5_9PSEU
MTAGDVRTDERRTDTRGQIRQVALELFAEQGYDKTSLREIAERLGITKAAVYYHFKTKEEILATLFDELVAGLDELIEWAGTQDPGPDLRARILGRYQELLTGGSADNLIRFVQEGQASLKDLAAGAQMRERFGALSRLLTPPDATVAEQLRSRLALVALHMGAFAGSHGDPLVATPEERRTAALEVARDLAR